MSQHPWHGPQRPDDEPKWYYGGLDRKSYAKVQLTILAIGMAVLAVVMIGLLIWAT